MVESPTKLVVVIAFAAPAVTRSKMVLKKDRFAVVLAHS